MIESKLELYLENFKQKNNFVEIDDNYRKLYSDFDEWDFKIILPYFHFILINILNLWIVSLKTINITMLMKVECC